MAQGQQNTYVNTVPQKRVVSDRIFMTDPMDIPLISALGMKADSKFKFVNTPGVKYEWLNDTYSPVSDIMTTAGAASSTTTTMVATDATKFQAGDVLLMDAEYITVDSVAQTTSTLTVTRNFGGTQAVHPDNTVAYIVGGARIEGADAGDTHYTQVTSQYNYSQIMQKTVEVSRSDARIQRYGIPNLVQYEIDKKMDEMKIMLNKLPYHGQRAAGSATTPRGAGGFDTFIASANKSSLSSGALTLKAIEDMTQTIYTAGGRPSLLVCGAWAKRKIASFFSDAVVTSRSEKLGGVEITGIMTALGFKLDVLVDRHCPAASLYILTPDEVSYVTIDEFFYEELGKVGDTAPGGYGEIVGEYGFAMAGDTHHGKIHTFSTTA